MGRVSLDSTQHGRHVAVSRDDEGFTLIELSVAIAIFALLMTMVLLAVSTFTQLSIQTTTTYLAADSILPVTDNFPRYFRAAVEPGPGLPPFQIATATQIEFTANVGDPNGPSQVNIQLSGVGLYSTLTLTVTPANAGTCPTTANITANPGATLTCTWNSAATRTLASVPNVPTAGGLTLAYLPISEPPSSAPSYATACSTNTWTNQTFTWAPTPPTFASTSPFAPTFTGTVGSFTFWTSNPVSSSNPVWCWLKQTYPTPFSAQLDQIGAVTMNVVVKQPASIASRQNTTYLLSTVSSQYQATVG
jgi:prepilin-type N-terminal cleavage/methylation domain-containing protein